MKRITSKKELGSSLIEVMVALLVMAIGLLGVLAMQTRAMQFNQNAYLYSQAAFLANDIMEAIQISGRNGNSYTTEFGGGITGSGNNCDTLECTDQQIVAWNIGQWQTNIQNFLPGGQGAIEALADGSGYIIKVRFRTREEEASQDQVEGLPMIVLRAGI